MCFKTLKEKQVHDEFAERFAGVMSKGKYTVKKWPGNFEEYYEKAMALFIEKTQAYYAMDVLNARWNGLTQEEIAKREDMTLRAVKTCETRGLNKISRLLWLYDMEIV